MRVAAIATIALFGAACAQAAQLVVWPEQMARLWDRDVRAAGEQLFSETAAGHDSDQLIISLEAVAGTPALDPVARDAALYHYTQRLRRLPVEDIPTGVLDWLMSYAPQAVTPHSESDSYLVPLFDVATTAHGVANERRYRLGRKSLLAATGEDYAHWLIVYSETADLPFQRGMAAAIADLPPTRLDVLAGLAASLPAVTGTPLFAEILLHRGEPQALADFAAGAQRALAGEVLNKAQQHLSPDDSLHVMQHALAHGDPGIRGLALSHGSRIARDHPHMRDHWTGILLSALDDAEAGSAAAMHLARILPPSALPALEARARPGHDRHLQLIRQLQNSGDTTPEMPR